MITVDTNITFLIFVDSLAIDEKYLFLNTFESLASYKNSAKFPSIAVFLFVSVDLPLCLSTHSNKG